jgi:hypothetical protein
LSLFNNGTLVDTLNFSGDYSNGDFSLQPDGNGTDILYAGTLSDFMPRWIFAAREQASNAIESHHITMLPPVDAGFPIPAMWHAGDGK